MGMNIALEIIYEIYSKFIDFVFNGMEIAENVSVGWIAITCFVFSILFRNILALPSKAGSVSIRSNKDE